MYVCITWTAIDTLLSVSKSDKFDENKRYFFHGVAVSALISVYSIDTVRCFEEILVTLRYKTPTTGNLLLWRSVS